MIPFDPANPFPLLENSERAYVDEKRHAQEVDRWLGLNIDDVEAAIKSLAQDGQLVAREEAGRSAEQELWIGLEPQALQTPYTELREALERVQPQPGSLVVDLGAGYGRLAHVLFRHFPTVQFLGYEILAARCEEGVRVIDEQLVRRGGAKSEQYRLVDVDLAQIVPEPAEIYFLYDYGHRDAVRKTLRDLAEIAGRAGDAAAHSIAVIGRGRLSRHLIETEALWLSQVVPPQHFDRYSIYRSR